MFLPANQILSGNREGLQQGIFHSLGGTLEDELADAGSDMGDGDLKIWGGCGGDLRVFAPSSSPAIQTLTRLVGSTVGHRASDGHGRVDC